MLSAHQQSMDRTWKIIFFICSALLLIVMPLLSSQYGQSGDEWLQAEYGTHIWEYFFEGNDQALGYKNRSLQYQNVELYGGLFDFAMEVVHRWLPGVPLLTVRHFFNAVTGALMMIFTGLFAYRISGKRWLPGVIALLFIAFSPRIFGESMNNPKDIPFGAGFIITLYFFLAILQEFPRNMFRYSIGICLGFGLAFGVRPAGGLLLAVYLVVLTVLYLWFNKDFRTLVFADKNKLFKKTLLHVVLALAGGYIIGILAWPWGLQAPLTNPLKSLQVMTNVDVILRVFFEGVFRPNNAQPWYYEFKWILMSNPLIVILGVVLFIVLFARARQEYGIIAVLFLLFAAFFSPLYMIYKKSSVHDSWRHLFFIYPFWVAMAALALPLIAGFIKHEKAKWLPLVIAVAGLFPTILWTFREHPNQYVYFNELVGGIQGAHGYYDTDYYQNSGMQAAKWLLKNARRTPGKKVLVGSNMLGFDKYFAKDTNWINYYYVRYNDRHTKEWDYYVTYSRFISGEQLQNDIWPPKNAIHEIKAGGVTLSAILERKSTAGIAANEALQKQDYATAAAQYAEFVKADAYDENAWANYGIALAYIGQLDAAVQAVTQAIQLEPGNPGFYQMLSQIHQARGDAQAAQQARNNANAIIMREQDLQGE